MISKYAMAMARQIRWFLQIHRIKHCTRRQSTKLKESTSGRKFILHDSTPIQHKIKKNKRK